MIKDLGELEQLLKLLREQGVDSFNWGDLSVELGDLPGQTVIESSLIGDELEAPEFPSQAELDRAVNMPVGGLDDPFLNYNEQQAE